MFESLNIPPALYDYVLYYECASKDWKKGEKKTTIKGDGSLMNLINWDSTYSYDPNDAGGKTLFGVTESSWQTFVEKYPNKGYSTNLNSMKQKGWLDIMEYYWNDYSYAGQCANYACAFVLFQIAWGGFNTKNRQKLLDILIKNANIKEYKFKIEGGLYEKIADATHAYTDPMIAYDYIRKAKSTYLYNISTPDKTNKIYRMGWLTRNILSFTSYGLYIPTTISYKNIGLKYESTLEQWESAANKLAQNNTNGYVKIMDWGRDPESVEKSSDTFYYIFDYTSDSSNKPSTFTENVMIYNECVGVNKLGQFTNTSYTQTSQQQSHIREEILKLLVKGSYTPNNVKKCTELLTSDKKKNIKT